MQRLVYHPPKSTGHGHGPKVRGQRKAWAAIQAFLNEHTVSKLRTPINLKLWDPSEWTDSAVVDATRQEAIEGFGPPTNISGEFYFWELPLERLSDAIEFAFADETRPKQALGPTSLYVSYSFTWKAIPNPPLLESRKPFSRGSSIGIFIGGRRVFIQPTFIFEASDQDPLFVSKLQELESAMPFTPKSSYYYRIEEKKSGNGEKLVKLAKDWQSPKLEISK